MVSKDAETRLADRRLGAAIALFRTVRGLTQEELARLLKVTVTTVSRWENGATTMSNVYLRRVADALSVKLADFYDPPDKVTLERKLRTEFGPLPPSAAPAPRYRVLTNADRTAIQAAFLRGDGYQDIADQFQTSRSTVWRIVHKMDDDTCLTGQIGQAYSPVYATA